MDQSRREVLTSAAGLVAILFGAGLLDARVSEAAEWNKEAFEQKKLADALKVLGANGAGESGQITIVAPDIAENGAVVPINVVSELPGTEMIALLVEKNPNLLAALYTLPAGTLADVQSRVKMAQTSDVVALVKAQGKFYFAKKEIKVTLGGCGG